MDIAVRPAHESDIPFIAWVQQEAARSHLPIGFRDVGFRVVDQKTNPDFARVVGAPGIRRLRR
jgi:hypothetical protein